MAKATWLSRTEHRRCITNTSSNGVYIDALGTYNTNITISNVQVEDCGGNRLPVEAM